MAYHVPVLLKECVDGLNIKPDGIYVDLTFGGGGHSKEILKHLTTGHLYGFDQDPDARNNADAITSSSFTFIDANFRYLKRYLKLHGVTKVDGILGDLGISSHQIDEGTRGFSTRFDAELDMRMDQQSPVTAKDILRTYTEDQLHKIFGMYGEVKNAKTLANAIIQARNRGKIETTGELISILKPLAPRGADFKYSAQVFQALRIEVNEELKVLEEMLTQSGEVLNNGGRLVIMSYHSLEDRLVKNYIAKGKFYGDVEKDIYGNFERPLEPVNKKPLEAGEEEIKANPRARSAKLRIAEKL